MEIGQYLVWKVLMQRGVKVMARSFNEKMEKKRQAEYNRRCILCGTAEGDVVLDPFVGSGTSCRVANRYGRQYIGD